MIPVRKFEGTETTMLGMAGPDHDTLGEFCRDHGDGAYLCGSPDRLLIVRVVGGRVTFTAPKEQIHKAIL